MTALRIDPVSEADLPDLRTLQLEFSRSIGEAEPDGDAFDRIAAAIEAGQIHFMLAREGDRPVGTCSLTIGFSTYGAAPFGVFDDFYVVPDRRKTGLARRLVDAVLAAARERGCRSVLGGVSDGDVEMWKHFGFRKIGNMMATDLPG